MNAVREKLALRDKFRAVLREATDQRDLRRGVVHTEFGPECEWSVYENAVMLNAVNQARAERGRPPVTATEVQRASWLAAGHVDWAVKFSLYCAELVQRDTVSS